jgi:hypothetical protein
MFQVESAYHHGGAHIEQIQLSSKCSFRVCITVTRHVEKEVRRGELRVNCCHKWHDSFSFAFLFCLLFVFFCSCSSFLFFFLVLLLCSSFLFFFLVLLSCSSFLFFFVLLLCSSLFFLFFFLLSSSFRCHRTMSLTTIPLKT